jgi:hypothetical protein
MRREINMPPEPQECGGMKVAISDGGIRKRWEDIDNKGNPSWTYEMFCLENGEMHWLMIKFCPFCGKQLTSLHVPPGECTSFSEEIFRREEENEIIASAEAELAEANARAEAEWEEEREREAQMEYEQGSPEE